MREGLGCLEGSLYLGFAGVRCTGGEMPVYRVCAGMCSG